MLKKKAVGYVYDALSEEYISLTFDDKAGHGGGMSGSNGISDVASEILDTVQKTQEDDEYYKKLKVLVDNANRAFEDKAGALKKEITDGIEEAKAQAEVVKEEISAQVTEKINAANQKNKNEIAEEFKAKYNGIEVNMEGLKATTDKLKTSDTDIQKLINDFKAQIQSQFVGIQGAQSRFEQTTEKAISDLTNVTNGKADRSFVEQTVAGVKEEFTTIGVVGGPNMLRNSRADEGLKYWTEVNNRLAFTAHQFYFNGQKRMFELRPGAVVKSPRFIVKQNADYTLNFLGFDNNSKMFKVYFCKRRKGSTADFEEKQLVYDGKPRWTDGPILDGNRAIKKSFQFNVGNFDDGYLQFEYDKNNPNKWGGLFLTELDFYEGTNDRKWQPAPEDQNYLVEQAQATFEKTVEGLTTQLTKLETKTGPSGELEQRMLTYSEKAAVDALKATRQILEQGYVAKSQYTEDVAGITRRFDEIVQAGENLLKNSGNPQNVEGWGYYDPGLSPAVTVSTNPIYYNESRKLFKLDNSTDNGKVAASQRFNIKRNTTYTISFDAIGSDNLKNATFYFLARKKGETGTFTKVVTLADKITVPQDRTTRYYFTVNTEDYDEAFLRFDNNGSSNGQSASLYFGDIDVYEGSIKRAYQPPTDNGSSVIEAKLAEYKQTVDGQFTTITNQMGDMLRKTDIQITPGQISFGTGKSINGRTISSLLVQEPESIALIAQLIKVKGDMVVDGSITSRHLASQSVRTGHMESGSVTTQILASNAVTADKLLVDSAMINKLVSNQAFIRELTSQKAFITQLNSIDIASNRFTGDRIASSDGSLTFDLVKNQLTMTNNTASISREDAGYPTQFIRYESSIENGHKHSKTIIGSNRNGSKNWNSVSFSGIVIDNNSNNSVDKVFQYGDYNHMRHASGDDGWNFSVVTQTLTPGTWNKNSEIWCRHFVIPKKTKSDTDAPTEFIRLDESVAALWKLWAHALGQINMTGAMKLKVQSMLETFSYDRDHIR